jgi:hypothetical protein
MADDGPLFIVDNAPNGRSGIEYLRQWCDVARSFDIATGYFDIGALLALDGDWQKLEGMRILMGDQVATRTKKALLEAVRRQAIAHLDETIEGRKQHDPFLAGADAVVAALKDGRIVCRVYNRDKFHAKAYITHGRLEVVGSQALVGSSNFTHPGLTQNIELNLNLESRLEVAQLQAWYERHWRDAVDVTPDVLKTVERHTVEYSPFDVYAKALQALVDQQAPAGAAWDEHGSKVFGKLDRYQQDAYRALLHIAATHGGAFLCDGVGLGKTFVGLMLIERLVNDGKRVALFAPKAVKEAVWDKEVRNHLAHIAGHDFSALSIFSHTDLSRSTQDFPQRFEDVARLADVVIVDEAHHFRNRGPQPDVDEDPSTWSRYHHLAHIISSGAKPKQLFLLTATPINNSLSDFRNLIQLWTGEDDPRFAQTLGVTSVQARLNQITKHVQQVDNLPDPDLADAPDLLQDALAEDRLFQGLVVQRSRRYVKESQRTQHGAAQTLFPEPRPPSVASYSLRRSHGKLIELLDESFEKDTPLFSLSIYYTLAFYTGPDDSIDPKVENRQKQVVGLIRTNFLKRFESSVRAFQFSCDRLLRRLLAFLKHHEPDKYDRWVRQNEDVLGIAVAPELGEEADEAEDVVPPELLEAVIDLPKDEYDMAAIVGDVLLDLDQAAKLLRATQHFSERDDDKLAKLVDLLRENENAGRKTLVFTEFADTARYLKGALERAGVASVEQLDGSRNVDRREVIERFSPYYNGTSSVELRTLDRAEIQVLVTTDVLAEGLNLQDATQLVNYDIHWNPVKLLQRIGRVDRRLNPTVERRLVTDHRHLAADRGKVQIHNFLPPDELELLLRLYERVAFKTLLISKTLGIERSFLKPDDDFEALKELNAKYEGSATAREQLQLELQRLLAANEGLAERLAALPGSVSSGKAADEAGTFLCYSLPALDQDAGAFTLEAGTTRWYLRRAEGTVVEDLLPIADLIRSDPTTPRLASTPQEDLLVAKQDVEKHLKNTYLRSLNAPLDAPRPKLVAWLDLVEA